jgi:hypothetical protein
MTGQINYTHIGYLNDISLFGSMQMPIFDRNQGEIKRAGFAITQAQEQQDYANGQVLTDVRDAYEGLAPNDEVVGLYRQAISTRRSSRWTLRNTRTNTARPACWIFWMQSGAIRATQLATGRRWHRTCRRWNSFAKR